MARHRLGGRLTPPKNAGSLSRPDAASYSAKSAGKEKVLHTFSGPNTCTEGGSDGTFSAAGVIQDAAGNLYGTTVFGGAVTTQG